MDPVTVLAAPQKVSFMRRTIIRCEPASKPLRDPRSEPPCVSMRLNQAGEVFTTAWLRMAARKAATPCLETAEIWPYDNGTRRDTRGEINIVAKFRCSSSGSNRDTGDGWHCS